MAAIQGAPRHAWVLVNWTEILRRAGLESPGYHEAVERTVTQWQRKQELKRMPKPRRKKKA